MKYRAIPQRVFIKDKKTGEPIFVNKCPEVAVIDRSLRPILLDIQVDENTFPPELDTIFPQDVYLVFQNRPNSARFFDPTRPGLMYVLRDFRVIYKEPPFIFLVDRESGEASQAPSEFEFFCHRVERVHGGS